ncbi:BapA/Bap/LapF family large adhesin [Acinetobacter thermotolerans]|uniref:BapA/Bap/LapF family large adhesin n=1 Tax=Acinetobacter thermotolerans TaxID=3151487 RepID=UPI00325C117D
MQVQVISKAGGSNKLIKEYIEAIQLKEESVVLIDVKIEDIEKIEYLDNKAIITLKNGEQIVIDNFNIEESSLVFRNENSELFLFDFETISYNPIDKIEPLLYGHSSSSFISIWPIAGLALGGIGLVAGAAGGSSSSSSAGSNTVAPKPPINTDMTKPGQPNNVVLVEEGDKDYITASTDKADAGSKVEITVPGTDPKEVIGTGTVDADGKIKVELTGELPEDGEIEIVITDATNPENQSDPLIVNVDTVAPILKDAVVNTAGAIELTFSEKLSGQPTATKDDFKVYVDGKEVTNFTIAVEGDKVTLTTVPEIYKGQSVVVSYQDNDATDHVDGQLSDAAGNDVSPFYKLITAEQNHSHTAAPQVPAEDKTAPELESAKVTETGRVELEFNEALDANNPPKAGDFTLTVDGKDVAIQDVIIAGNKVTLVPVTPIVKDQTVELAYKDPTAADDANALQDTSGNDVKDFSSTELNGGVVNGSEVEKPTEPAVDTTAPTLESAKVTETGRVELEFSETIDANHPPKAEDFTLTVDGETVAIQDVIIVGNKVTLVPVTPIVKDQTVELAYKDPTAADDANALQDTSGNDVKDFSSTELNGGVVNGSEVEKPTEPAVDTTAPTLESAKVTETGRVELEFSETIDANHPPKAEDFTLTVDGETVAIQDVIIVGNKVTLVPVTPIVKDQTVELAYKDPTAADDANALQDTSGNDVKDFSSTELNGGVVNGSEVEKPTEPAVDTTAPTLESAKVTETGRVELEFSETIDANHPPKAEDFTLTVDGETVAIQDVIIVGNKVTLVPVTPIVKDQTVELAYKDPTAADDANALQDTSGNDVKDFSSTELNGGVVNGSEVEKPTEPAVDTTAPTLESAKVTETGRVELEFSETIDANHPPKAEDFTLTVDGETVAIQDVIIVGNKVTLVPVTPIVKDQTVELAYKDPTAADDANALQDTSGNDVKDFSSTELNGGVVNGSEVEKPTEPAVDTTAPTLESAKVTETGRVELEFSETIDANHPPKAEDFTLTVDGETVAIQDVIIVGNKVTLVPVTPIVKDQTVELAYKDPTAADDANALQDTSGNDVKDFSSTELNGGVVNGSEVEKPTEPAVDTTAPTLESAKVTETGRVELEFSETIDANHPPKAEDFTLTVDGETVAIQDVIIVGNKVTLVPVTPIVKDQTVELAYKDPTAADDANALQDTSGNDVKDFSSTELNGGVVNGSEVEKPTEPAVDTTAPTLESAKVTETGRVELEFSETIDANHPPKAEDFTLTVDGETVAIQDVIIVGNKVTLVPVTPIVKDQTVELAYKDPTAADDANALQDTSGNDVKDFSSTELNGGVVNGSEVEKPTEPAVDTTAPTLESAKVTETGRVELEFSETIDANHPPKAEDFTLTVDGETVAIQDVIIVGNKVTLVPVTPIVKDQTVELAYKDPTAADDANALQDTSGNDVKDFSSTELNGGVVNGSEVEKPTEPAVDTTAPTLESAKVTETGRVELEFSETIDANHPPKAEDFTLTVDGETVAIQDVIIVGNKVTLVPVTPIVKDQTVELAYKDPTAADDANALQDTSGNDVKDFSSTELNGGVVNGSEVEKPTEPAVDTTAPTLESAKVTETGRVELEFSETIDANHPPKAEDFTLTVDGETVAIQDVIIVGNKVTLVPVTPIVKDQTVELAYKDPTAADDANALQDTSGNDVKDFSSTELNGGVVNGSEVEKPTEPAVDTTAPTLESAKVTETGRVELEFSETIDANHPPKAEDFTLTVDGETVAIQDVIIVGNKVTLVPVTPIVKDQTVELAYKDPTAADDANALQDTSGNDVKDFSSTELNGGVVNGSEVEKPTEPAVDTTAPTLESAKVTETGRVELEFSETIDANHPPKVEDFTLTVDGETVAIQDVIIVGNKVTLVPVTPIVKDQTVELAYKDPTAADDANALQDTSGNDVKDFSSTELNGGVVNGSEVEKPTEPAVDTTAPTLESAKVTETGRVELEFSETIDANHPPKAEDFTLTVDGETVAIQDVIIVGNKVTLVPVTPIVKDQTVELAYKDPTAADDANALQDTSGNDVKDFSSTELNGGVVNGSEVEKPTEPAVDTTAPTLESAKVTETGRVELEFSETIDANHPPKAEDFTLTVDGETVAIQDVIIVGNKVTLVPVTPIVKDQTVELAYKDPTAADDANALQDTSGNDVKDFSSTELNGGVVNGSEVEKPTEPAVDTTAPTLESAKVTETGRVELEFSETIDANHPPKAEDFTLTVDGETVAIQDVIIVGNKVTLVPVTPIVKDQTVELAYKDPTAADDANALQDTSGNDVKDFSSTELNGGVVNGSEVEKPTEPAVDTTAPTLESAKVTETGRVELEFSETIDANHPPKAEDFTLTVDGETVAIQDVIIVGNKVTLVPVTPIVKDQTVELAYKDPTAADDANALQDTSGNDVKDFSSTELNGGVVNGSEVEKPTEPAVDTTAPTLESAKVTETGRVELEFSETIDANHPPKAEDFTLTVDGETVAIQDVIIVGNKVTLVPVTPIVKDQTVELAYKDPTAADDANALQDTSGNDVKDFSSTELNGGVVNGSEVEKPTEPAVDTTAPTLESAKVTETGRVELEFNEALDANNPPKAGDFTLTVDGETVAIQDVIIVGNKVTLVPVTPIVKDQTVELAYKDPTAADDANALQDTSGNDVVGFMISTEKTENPDDVEIDNGLQQFAKNDYKELNMGEWQLDASTPIVHNNLQVIDLLDIVPADSGAVVQVTSAESLLTIYVQQTALAAVADAFRVDIVNNKGEIVYSASSNPELVGDVLGIDLLEVTGDDKLIVRVSDLPEGDYRVIVRNNPGALSNLLDANKDGISLSELGQAGVLLGPENQEIVLNTLSDALGVLGPLVTKILKPVLTVLNGLPVDEILNPIVNALNRVGVTGLLDDVLSLVAKAVLNNTLTLLQQTTITTQISEFKFENLVAEGNILDNDVKSANELTLTKIQFGDDVIDFDDQDEVSINGLYGTLTIDKDGNYSYISNGNPEAIGQNDEFIYTVSNGEREEQASLTIHTKDIYPPESPTFDVLNGRDPILGQAEPGVEIIVTQNGIFIGKTIADENGIWQLQNPGLTHGAEITAIAVDKSQNMSSPSIQIVDALAPTITLDLEAIDRLDSTPQLTGTIDDPTAIVKVIYLGKEYTAQVNPDEVSEGIYQWTLIDDMLPIMPNGTNEISVIAIDKAGNKSALDAEVIINADLTVAAASNIVQANLAVVVDTATNENTELGYIFKDTGFSLVSAGLGPVLDAAVLGDIAASATTLKVAENTVREITMYADAGGVFIGTMDLFIYKLNTTTGMWEQQKVLSNWYGGFLGGKSKQYTHSFDEGEWMLVLANGQGLAVATGYSLYFNKETVYDYSNIVAVSGTTTGNVLTDDDIDYGTDYIPAGTKVVSISYADKNYAVTEGETTIIETPQGTLYIDSSGKYSFVVAEQDGTTFSFDQVDSFIYTVMSAEGKVSSAKLDIEFNLKPKTSEIELNNIVIADTQPSLSASKLITNYTSEENKKYAGIGFNLLALDLGIPSVLDATALGGKGVLSFDVAEDQYKKLSFYSSTGGVTFGAKISLLIYKYDEMTQQYVEVHSIKNWYDANIGGKSSEDKEESWLSLGFGEGSYKAVVVSDAVFSLGEGSGLYIRKEEILDYNTPAKITGSTSGRISETATIVKVNQQELSFEEPLTIKGEYGVLSIKQNGEYTYSLYSKDHENWKKPYGEIERFNLVVKDQEGNLSIDTLNIAIQNHQAIDDINEIESISKLTDSSLNSSVNIEATNKKVTTVDFALTNKEFIEEITFSGTVYATVRQPFLTMKLYKNGVDISDLVQNVGSLTLVDQPLTDDYLINGSIQLPKDLGPGSYRIELSLTSSSSTSIFRFKDVNATSTVKNSIQPYENLSSEQKLTEGKLLQNDLNSEEIDILKIGSYELYVNEPNKGATDFTIQGLYGSLKVFKDGRYEYMPSGHSSGTDTFVYTTISKIGLEQKATLSIDVDLQVHGSAADDIVKIGSGADTLIFDLLDNTNNGGNGLDTWTDFEVGPNGDKINLVALLDGNQSASNIQNYLSIIEEKNAAGEKTGNVILQVDRDGKTYEETEDGSSVLKDDQFSDTNLLILQSTDVTLEQLLQNNQIIY